MKYIYVIFEDEANEVFIMRDVVVKNCVFAGAVGDVKEVERGEIIRPTESENDNLFFIRELLNKKNEYENKVKKQVNNIINK